MPSPAVYSSNYLIATYFTLWIWGKELSCDSSCHWTVTKGRTETPAHPPGLYLGVTFSKKPPGTSKNESGPLLSLLTGLPPSEHLSYQGLMACFLALGSLSFHLLQGQHWGLLTSCILSTVTEACADLMATAAKTEMGLREVLGVRYCGEQSEHEWACADDLTLP